MLPGIRKITYQQRKQEHINEAKKGPDGREDDRNGEKNQWKTEGGNLHLLNTVSTKRGHIQETSAK